MIDRDKVIEKLEKYTEQGSYDVGVIHRCDFINLAEEIVKLFAIPDVSGSSLFVIELSDEYLQIVTKDELDKMYEDAMEFDGFLGYTVKGRLV